jgi:homoserine dehydrogenase
MKTVNIGLLGCGTVGGGLVDLLRNNRDLVARRSGLDLNLRRVLVRDPEKERPCDPEIITTSPESILEDPGIDIVVELIGGLDPAGPLLLEAIRSGKNVVTANKALLARSGREIFDYALDRKVRVGFEASVCAGIPILRAISDGLVGNRILALVGILNGTSNFILTRMTEEKCSFADALATAKARGFAEADPALDLSGQDAAAKLKLLSELAFGIRIENDAFPVRGIEGIEPEDIRSAAEMGFVIKPLAIALDLDHSLHLSVHPALLPEKHPLAHIRDEFNSILLRGDAVDEMIFTGKGAGALPTASAVLADIISIAGAAPGETPHEPRPCSRPVSGEVESEYYLRFPIRDVPGVIGLISTALGNRGISISHATARLAEDRPGRGNVKILAHRCGETLLRRSLDQIARLPILDGKPVLLPIVNGEPSRPFPFPPPRASPMIDAWHES